MLRAVLLTAPGAVASSGTPRSHPPSAFTPRRPNSLHEFPSGAELPVQGWRSEPMQTSDGLSGETLQRTLTLPAALGPGLLLV